MKRITIERIVVFVCIGTMALMALAFDVISLWEATITGGLRAAGRGIAAIALGWICGWYFTIKFAPTRHFLSGFFFQLGGHFVAMLSGIAGIITMIVVGCVGSDPNKATFLGITTVTFIPIASFFSTQLSEDRSVHMLCGFGIGALLYIVMFGMPG